jgi:hypothetical protein
MDRVVLALGEEARWAAMGREGTEREEARPSFSRPPVLRELELERRPVLLSSSEHTMRRFWNRSRNLAEKKKD